MNENNENFVNAMPYQQQQSFLPPYGNTIPQYQTKPKPTFTGREKVLSIVIAVLSFLFVHFVLWNSKGFFTTAFYLTALTVSLTYLKKIEYEFLTSHKLWSVLMYSFSLVFSITANDFVKQLDSVFLHLGIAYLIYSVTSKTPMFGRFAVFEMLKSSISNPLSHFGKEYSAVNSAVKSTKRGTDIKAIICGLVLALPLTVIVAALLISADEGVEKMLNSLAATIMMENVFTFIPQFAVSIPVSGYLFGLIYSHTHPEITKPLDEERCKQSTSKLKIAANMAVYSAVTPICVLYVMFFISQTNYFLSAFMGRLPENFSYSEYARKGFFELFAIEVINALVILFMNFCSKRSGDEKPAALKIYSVVISIFTLLITATAVSKMFLYIQNFGLTQLRVYTTWFMLLTAIMFIFVIIRQFRSGFPFMRSAAVVFTIFFGILCFSRPDAMIARYNMENCTEHLSYYDISKMSELSADSAAVILEPKYRQIINDKFKNSHDWSDSEMMFDQGYVELVRKARYDLSKNDYNEYNFSAIKLKKYID